MRKSDLRSSLKAIKLCGVLILALVSLWLLVNSFKETFKEKLLIDFFYYFIQRYFDYFIIILPFLDLIEVTA